MRAAQAQQPLPPDIRLMNGVTALLLLGLAAAVLTLALQRLMRQPVFAIRAVQVEGEVSRNSAASLRANAVPRLAGSFLSMNLQQARAAFEAVPWVRHAVVQRVWPNRLKVSLEEHKPAAYWETKPEGADADSDATVERLLVNSFGEVFQANLGDVEDEDLPLLSGPAHASAHMLKLWQQLQTQTARLDDSIERLDLSGRGSWRITLAKGSHIELGRGSDAEVLARYGQFVASIQQITSRYKTDLLSADLRHGDGYALRLRGVSTTPTPPKGGAKKN
ncbi:cell division protein FtsQ/DivIB [Paucibacter sp. APW11]|uniref:Cell division protein FtsQ n=1 Tax=Roseateles aquae TaxID=3077235 RepID=A0ABU3PCK3_9BURK|nr:cell division protein FtsQ/DivIB [Paucibacter sp. APW11]MDT9000273.1 cell division protein FtsQ/DivIB [Paucibacter sp. APW11]